MARRFQKRVKILPGVYVNVSKNGISTTVGVKGASVNIGKRGTYLNTSIPGTGISERTRLDKPTSKPTKAGTSTGAPLRSVLASYFPSDQVDALLTAMSEAEPQAVASALSSPPFKKPITIFLLSLFLGYLGVDRFALGQPLLGFLKLVTAGGFFVWWLVDLFLVSSITKQRNLALLVSAEPANGESSEDGE